MELFHDWSMPSRSKSRLQATVSISDGSPRTSNTGHSPGVSRLRHFQGFISFVSIRCWQNGILVSERCQEIDQGRVRLTETLAGGDHALDGLLADDRSIVLLGQDVCGLRGHRRGAGGRRQVAKDQTEALLQHSLRRRPRKLVTTWGVRGRELGCLTPPTASLSLVLPQGSQTWISANVVCQQKTLREARRGTKGQRMDSPPIWCRFKMSIATTSTSNSQQLSRLTAASSQSSLKTDSRRTVTLTQGESQYQHFFVIQFIDRNNIATLI